MACRGIWRTARPCSSAARATNSWARVSMDMIAVDVTGAAKVATGNKAIIWGEGLPVEEIAAHAGTIPYELLCGVSQRVPLELK